MNVTDRIALFVTLLQDLYDKNYAASYANLLSPRIEAPEGGRKYQRVVVTQRYENNPNGVLDGQSSVYCFIDLNTGDILKAAGWNSPAKGVRGNIFNENCDVGTRATVFGSGLYR